MAQSEALIGASRRGARSSSIIRRPYSHDTLLPYGLKEQKTFTPKAGWATASELAKKATLQPEGVSPAYEVSTSAPTMCTAAMAPALCQSGSE